MELKQEKPFVKNEKYDEIVRQAFNLFYKEGFHATGVDTVLEGTGISKRTLYKHFGSKESLIAATVEYYRSFAYGAIYDYINKKTNATPKEKVLRLFDYLYEMMEKGEFSGCFAMNAKSEYNGLSSEIEASCNAHATALEALVHNYLKEAKISDSKKVAGQIMILFDGAIVRGKLSRNSAPAKQARSVVKFLLETQKQ